MKQHNHKKIFLSVILNSDSDCYTVLDGKHYMIDWELSGTGYITKTTKDKVCNEILKYLNNVSYVTSDVHYFIKDNKKRLTKEHIPKIITEIKNNLIETIKKLKSTPFENLDYMLKIDGGNQYSKVEILLQPNKNKFKLDIL